MSLAHLWWEEEQKKSERENLSTNCLQDPSSQGHGLQKAKMNEISFVGFFFFLFYHLNETPLEQVLSEQHKPP